MLDVLASPPAAAGAPPALEPALEQALGRLQFANQIRELADEPEPLDVGRLPPLNGWLARWVGRIIRAADGLPSDAKSGAAPYARAVLRDVGAVIGLRLFLRKGGLKRCAGQTAGAVLRVLTSRRARYYSRPTSTMTAYVHADASETMLIRSCLLLRLMRRYAACIEFLIARLRSGLPSVRTRGWLAFFLREIGDEQGAVRLAATAGAETLEPLPPPAPARASRLTYGLVVTVMFDSPVLRRSLQSLVESDFRGDILVVEDGHRPQRFCEAFCKTLPVTYVKNPTWGGPTGAVNFGFQQLRSDLSILLCVHSDVLWPRRWFAPLQEAWEQVFETKKVGMLNLPYLEFDRVADPILGELFAQNRYEDLVWLLQTMRPYYQPLGGRAHAMTLEDPTRRFGLSRNAWVDRPANLQLLHAVFSVGSSFLRESWRQLEGFAPEMPYGTDLELLWHHLQQRQWTLYVNTPPLIHQVSTDSRFLIGTDREESGRQTRVTLVEFAKKYGWEYDHLLLTYFSEVTQIHREAIVEAANSLRFDDVDHLFEETFERMRRKRLANCEFSWCKSRERCPYG